MFMIHSFILEDVRTLLDHENSIRPSIQFTMEKKEDNGLSFLEELITRTEQGSRLSAYSKPIFTGHYLNFNSHHLYNVKKGIVHFCYNTEQKPLVMTATHMKKKLRV